MVHAKNETPATANNAEINIFNFSFILFFLLYEPEAFHINIYLTIIKTVLLFEAPTAPSTALPPFSVES